jgi:hypothetical protein
MTTPGKPITGGVALRLPAIESPNYVPGVSGWAIFQNGTVEFNSGTFRGTVTAGTFEGTDFEINSNGAFFYSGTPAAGNLIASITSAAGTDHFGNNYGGPGLTTYAPGGDTVQITGADITLAEATTNTTWSFFTQVLSGIPYLKLVAAGASSGVLWFTDNGILLATDPNSFLPETWHDMTPGLLNGWTVTASQDARYRLMEDNSVWIDADLTAGTLAGGTNVWTAPTGYIPGAGIARRVPATLVASTAAAQAVDPYFTMAAHLQCHNMVANQTRFIINARYTLAA